MAYVVVTSAPEADVLSAAAVKMFLRITNTSEDQLIASLIAAAREMVEVYTGKSIVKKSYAQYLDSFPYYTDTVMSQQAYPPSYYSLPRYSTTLWNYSQMIKLFYPPCISVDHIDYVGTDNAIHSLTPGTDFQVDFATEPARLFPLPGQTWPAVKYCANAVGIFFAAGYEVQSSLEPSGEGTGAGVTEPETDSVSNTPGQRNSYVIDRTVPERVLLAVKQLVLHWYQNRDMVVAGNKFQMPNHVEALLDTERFIDFAPTRG